MTALQPEDAKLVTLARSARARTRAAQGAAVRDGDGRTYVAATVALPSLELSALQVAVAMAVSSGAPGLEADHAGAEMLFTSKRPHTLSKALMPFFGGRVPA